MKEASSSTWCVLDLWYDLNPLCGIFYKVMNNLLRSWSSFIYLFLIFFGLRCIKRKAESQYSREITSCHNYKCWGLRAVQSAAQRRWAVCRPWVKAESCGRPHPAGSCHLHSLLMWGSKRSRGPDAANRRKDPIACLLNASRGQITRKPAQRLLKVINAFRFFKSRCSSS